MLEGSWNLEDRSESDDFEYVRIAQVNDISATDLLWITALASESGVTEKMVTAISGGSEAITLDLVSRRSREFAADVTSRDPRSSSTQGGPNEDTKMEREWLARPSPSPTSSWRMRCASWIGSTGWRNIPRAVTMPRAPQVAPPSRRRTRTRWRILLRQTEVAL
jgi:hypothetical protein